MKYFLTKKEYLGYFKDFPSLITLTSNKNEYLNLSYLQIAALLSFDPSNHSYLRESGLVRKILRSGLFKVVLMTLKNEKQFAKLPKTQTFNDKPWMKVLKGAD